jgi:multidrug resistance efflux pump
VMEEAMDQDQIVQYDPNGKSTDNVTRAAQALSRSQGGHAVLSLPMRRNEEVIGVIALEFLPSQQLGPQVAHGLAVAVDLLAPNLYDRYQNDRWLITKTGISIREAAKLAIGPKHMLAKLVIVLVLGLLAFTFFYKPMYRVTAPFQFVPTEKLSVSSPFDGIIETIGEVNGQRIRPGMTVKAGTVLVTLKTDDKKSELYRVQSEILRNRKEAEYHRARNEIAEMQMKLLAAQGAEAEATLLQSQISKASITAPYDAIVLKGDLTDKLGAPLKEGDSLLELGPKQDLRVEMYVNERDIQDVKDGQLLGDAERQVGKLATTSKPTDKFGFKVERIVPIPQPRDTSNVFMVYGQLESRDKEWRPGMMGEARIDVAPKRLLWQWTHRLVDWVRLKTWF